MADATALSNSDTTTGSVHEFEIDESRSAEDEGLRPREKWSFNVEFIFSSFACCVAYTTMWSLPYFMFRNGGVLFLIPYISFLLLLGAPLLYLETCLGQFWGKGPFHIWRFCPIFRGVGVSLILTNFLYVWYSNCFLSWFVYYAALSLSSQLPWLGCDNSWSTQNCSHNTATLQFYEDRALQQSSSLDELGSLRGELVGCMAAASFLMFAALFYGIKVTGKIVLVTVPLFLIILAVLFFRGVTLSGARTGILFLLSPDLTKMSKLETWTTALTHVIFTIFNPAVIHTLASYNDFKAPCLRNTFIVIGMLVTVGIVNAITVFTFFGALAEETGQPLESVAHTGLGLTFVAVPQLLARFPTSQFWCFIFFVMHFLSKISNQFLSMEVFIRTVLDIIPRSNRKIRVLVTAGVCGGLLILTLPFLTQGGVHLLTLFDVSVGKITVWAFLFLECLTVVGFYGLNQFSGDIQMMTGLRPPVVYKFIWAFLIPPIAWAMFIYRETENNYKLSSMPEFEESADIAEYFIAVVPLIPIPVFVVVWFVRSFRSGSPVDPPLDLKPATDRWVDYDLKQRKMERSALGNFTAIFKT